MLLTFAQLGLNSFTLLNLLEQAFMIIFYLSAVTSALG